MLKYFLLVFLFVTALQAGETVTTVHVKGSGVSRSEAIQNALIEALKQTKGVSIDSKKAFSKNIRQSNVSDNGENSRYVGVKSLSQSRVKEATRGIIDRYRVIDEQRYGAHNWEVVLAVKILGYRSPGLSTKNRRKIAVMPFYVSKRYFDIGGRRYSGAELSDMLTQALTNVITQSRRFAVVDRSYTRDMARELGIIASGETPLAQRVKLGQKLSADYLLVGTIKAANMHTTHAHNQLLGTDSSKTEAEFIVDYRVIVVGTSQIKWSDTKKMTILLSNAHQSSEMALSNAVERVASSIANELLSNIYPIRILKITRDGYAVLNQGGNTLKKGEKLSVMHLGEKMIDPYTHESLGRMERKVATLEVTEVTAKLSYAKVIEGSVKGIKKGDICRRERGSAAAAQSSKMQDNPNWRKSTVKVQEGGGVKLPFD